MTIAFEQNRSHFVRARAGALQREGPNQPARFAEAGRIVMEFARGAEDCWLCKFAPIEADAQLVKRRVARRVASGTRLGLGTIWLVEHTSDKVCLWPNRLQ